MSTQNPVPQKPKVETPATLPSPAVRTARVNLGGIYGSTVDISDQLKGIKPTLSDPAPFDIDAEFAKWINEQPIEIAAEKHDAFANVLHTLSQPFISQGYNTMAAMNRANAGLFTHLDLVGDFIGRITGADKGGLFKDLAKTFEENAGYWRHKAEQNGLGFIDELVSDAVGGTVPSVAQFMLDLSSYGTLPFAAGYEAAAKQGKDPIAAGLVEAAKNRTLGFIFRTIAPLNAYMRAPLMGTVGGIQAAAEAPEGKKVEAAFKGAVTMGAFGAFPTGSPGERLGLNEVAENAKALLSTGVVKTAKGIDSWVNFVDRSRMEVPDGDLRELLFNEEGAITFPNKVEREGIYQDVVNRFAALENLPERARALGATFRPGEDIKLRTRGYLGVGGKALSVLKDKTYAIGSDGKIRITGEGFEPIVRDYERLSPETDRAVKKDEFDDYFTAVRTIEDLQRSKSEWTTEQIVTPQQVADARQILSELKAKYGEDLPQFNAVAERYYSFMRRLLHMEVDSGNLSQAQYDAIIAVNPHYVPFDRVLDKIESEAGGAPRASHPFTEARTTVKRIRGSELPIEDVVASTIRHVFRTMDVAERNTVARLVGRLANNPDVGSALGIERVPVPVHAIRVSPDEINTITRTLRSRAQEVREEIRQSSTTTGPGAAPAATTGPMKKLEGIVTDSLKARGFTEGEAASALEQIKKAAAAKGQPESAPGATQTVTQTIEKTINRIVKETEQLVTLPTESTIWRPSPYKPKGKIIEYYENGKKQYIDVPENLYEAMSGLTATGANAWVKFFSKPASWLRSGTTLIPDFWLRNFIRDNWDAFIQSKLGFKPFIDPAAALADIVGKTDAYYDWLRSGAAHSTFIEISRDNLAQMAEEIRRDPSAWKYLNVVTDAKKISQAVEEATRIGIYKAAIRNGKTPVEAMFAAREGTVDFGVHGQSEALRNFSQVTAFLNPGIQAFDRVIRAHKEDPAGTAAKALAAITVPSLMLWMFNKDDPEYKEMPTWRKRLFWNLHVGDENSFVRWISIPKPFALGMAYGSAVESFADYLYEKDPKAFKGLIGDLVDSATPVQGDPSAIFLPTFLRPIMEWSTNWNFFKERPIVPESKEKLVPELQYGKYTSEIAKLIGERLGRPPAKIENTIVELTGGTGRYALQGMDLAIDALIGKKEPERPTEAADVPVLKAFVGRPVESDPQSLRDFYEDSKKIEAAYMSLRDQIKNKELASATRIMQDHPKLLLSPSVTAIKTSIGKMDKLVEAFAASPTDSEVKRTAIRVAEKIRLRMAQLGNNIIGEKLSQEEVGKETKELAAAVDALIQATSGIIKKPTKEQ